MEKRLTRKTNDKIFNNNKLTHHGQRSYSIIIRLASAGVVDRKRGRDLLCNHCVTCDQNEKKLINLIRKIRCAFLIYDIKHTHTQSPHLHHVTKVNHSIIVKMLLTAHHIYLSSPKNRNVLYKLF